jgi:hypothetical protein
MKISIIPVCDDTGTGIPDIVYVGVGVAVGPGDQVVDGVGVPDR